MLSETVSIFSMTIPFPKHMLNENGQGMAQGLEIIFTWKILDSVWLKFAEFFSFFIYSNLLKNIKKCSILKIPLWGLLPINAKVCPKLFLWIGVQVSMRADGQDPNACSVCLCVRMHGYVTWIGPIITKKVNRSY